MKDIINYNLKENNTFGIEAKCNRFVDFESEEEVKEFFASPLYKLHTPYMVIGEGSNLLLTNDYKGTVFHSSIKGKQISNIGDDILLTCGSGEKFDDIVAFCVTNGFHGLENLSLIPGDVGASAVQNIGAYGAEVKDAIYSVIAVNLTNGRVSEIKGQNCGYAYRQSRFKNEWHDRYLITYVTYRLKRTFTPLLEYGNIKEELKKENIIEPTAKQLRDVIIKIRKAKLPDPKVQGNAGSFFMNPVITRKAFENLLEDFADIPHYDVDENHVKIPAAWLIDKCGWKGKSIGKAGVHSKQPLVLVNLGGATGSEIQMLCNTIKSDVKEMFGINLSTEVNIR